MSRYDVDISVQRHVLLMRSLEQRGLAPDFQTGGLEMLSLFAWGHWLSGEAEAFCRYTDALHCRMEAEPGKVQSPETKFFLFSLDFRIPLLDTAAKLLSLMPTMKAAPNKQAGQAKVNSVTQNLPLLHRSMRDYSEFVPAGEAGFELLGKTFGVLLGPEYQLFQDTVRAGLAFERGETGKAGALAEAACREAKNCRSLELYVSAQVIRCLILREQGENEQAGQEAAALEVWLTEHEAHFLRPNVQALFMTEDLRQGGYRDKALARSWLERSGWLEPVAVFRLPGYFATARALLTTDMTHEALALLDRLSALADAYRRPLDSLEAQILRCLTLMRQGRTDEAASALESARRLAEQYGYRRMPDRELGAYLPPPDGRCRANTILTPRRLDLLRCLEQGLNNQETAATLGIALNTVKTELKSLYRVLNVTSRRDAVAAWKIAGQGK